MKIYWRDGAENEMKGQATEILRDEKGLVSCLASKISAVFLTRRFGTLEASVESFIVEQPTLDTDSGAGSARCWHERPELISYLPSKV